MGPLEGKMDERDEVGKKETTQMVQISFLFDVLPTQVRECVPSQPCVVSADTFLIH